MTYRFDEKGKFFTDVITKNAVPAKIQTTAHRIHGLIYVREEERVSDELNSKDQFLAVTDATIFGADGSILFEADFLAINTAHIIWLLPEERASSEENTPAEENS